MRNKDELYKGWRLNYKGRRVEIFESRELCLRNAMSYFQDSKFLKIREQELGRDFSREIDEHESQWRDRVRWLKANG